MTDAKQEKRTALVAEARDAAGLGDHDRVAELNAQIAALDKPERAVKPRKATEKRKG